MDSILAKSKLKEKDVEESDLDLLIILKDAPTSYYENRLSGYSKKNKNHDREIIFLKMRLVREKAG